MNSTLDAYRDICRSNRHSSHRPLRRRRRRRPRLPPTMMMKTQIWMVSLRSMEAAAAVMRMSSIHRLLRHCTLQPPPEPLQPPRRLPLPPLHDPHCTPAAPLLRELPPRLPLPCDGRRVPPLPPRLLLRQRSPP